MAGKPLKLDWTQILPEKESANPSVELEVVPTPHIPSSSPMIESSSSPIERNLSDGELEDKIQRLAKHLESNFANSLPDKGRKLRANYQACLIELDRRKLARIQKTAENCDTATESTATDPSECNSRSTFFSLFNQTLDKKAGSVSISKISSANPCQIREGKELCHVSSQATGVSSRPATPQPTSKVSFTEEKKSSDANCRSIETSSFYAPRSERRYSKRLKLSEGRNILVSRTKKVQDVVLLDEEDLQPKDPIRYAFDDWKEAKICYPSRDHPEAVELSFSDLKCLEPEQFLSSPIMNFYIWYLQRPLSKTKAEYYFFNTYFFGKLVEASSSSKGDSSLQFSKLRRWWKGVNIFEKAYIFLPIHRDLHWSLIIISIPPKEDEPHPIILHLDSLGLHESLLIFEVVQWFLKEEWKYVKQNIPSPDISNGENMLIYAPLKIDKKEIKVPQQKNEYDCGIFVLYFMERFIDEAPQRLNTEDLNMFGSKWFQAEDASGLRKRIQNLLLEEFESSRLECGEEVRHDQSPRSSSEAEEDLTVKSF